MLAKQPFFRTELLSVSMEWRMRGSDFAGSKSHINWHTNAREYWDLMSVYRTIRMKLDRLITGRVFNTWESLASISILFTAARHAFKKCQPVISVRDKNIGRQLTYCRRAAYRYCRLISHSGVNKASKSFYGNDHWHYGLSSFELLFFSAARERRRQ